MLSHYNKDVYRSCQHCRCVIEIKKGFKKDPSVCNECFKLLQNQDRINPQIQIIWTENQKYRVFTNFHRFFWTKYLEWKTSKENVVKFCKKLLKLLNIRYQGEPLGYDALTLPN